MEDNSPKYKKEMNKLLCSYVIVWIYLVMFLFIVGSGYYHIVNIICLKLVGVNKVIIATFHSFCLMNVGRKLDNEKSGFKERRREAETKSKKEMLLLV